MDNTESQVKTVSEIFGCSHDEAKEMLVKCDRVLDKCVESTSREHLAPDVTHEISSVLKRKKCAEEPDVVSSNENEKKKAKEDVEVMSDIRHYRSHVIYINHRGLINCDRFLRRQIIYCRMRIKCDGF